jgi:hypothetical protein
MKPRVCIREVSFLWQLHLQLTRNENEQNWYVEINGQPYDFVSIEEVKALVHRAVVKAQEFTSDAMRRSQ